MKGSPLNKTASTLTKWLIALLLGTGLVFIARASFQSTVYLPLSSNQKITATATPTLVPGTFIIDIEFAPETHPLDEYVTIRNQTGKFVPMEGWTLQDENHNKFTFPLYTLTSWVTVKVWTKDGVIDPENLYWGRTEPVWNDHGDCAYLRDDDGKLVDSECYGALSLIQIFP